MIRKLFFFIVAALLFTSPAFSAIRYTDDNGAATTGNCTVTQTGAGACTFAYAKTQMAAGDTLSLADGTYVTGATINDDIPSGAAIGTPTIVKATNVVTCTVLSCVPNVILRPTGSLAGGCCIAIITSNNHILFQGIKFDCAAASTCMPFFATGTSNGLRFEDDLFANGSCVWIDEMTTQDCSGLELAGATIVNWSVKRSHATDNGPTTYNTHGFYIAAGAGIIEECYAEGNGGWGFHSYCGAGDCDAMIIQRNVATNNGQDTGHPGGGYIVSGCTDCIVRNNIAYDEVGNGIDVLNGCSDCVIVSNTVYSSTGTGIALISGSTGTIIRNNILDGNGTDSISDAATGTIASNNRCDIAFNCNIGGGTGSVTSTPGFVSPPTNLHLESSSALNGAGVAVAGVTVDFDNVPRGNPPEIGAYEIVSASIRVTSVFGGVTVQ